MVSYCRFPELVNHKIKFYQVRASLQFSNHLPHDGPPSLERQDEGRLFDLHPVDPRHSGGAAAGACDDLLQAHVRDEPDIDRVNSASNLRSLGKDWPQMSHHWKHIWSYCY